MWTSHSEGRRPFEALSTVKLNRLNRCVCAKSGSLHSDIIKSIFLILGKTWAGFPLITVRLIVLLASLYSDGESGNNWGCSRVFFFFRSDWCLGSDGCDFALSGQRRTEKPELWAAESSLHPRRTLALPGCDISLAEPRHCGCPFRNAKGK